MSETTPDLVDTAAYGTPYFEKELRGETRDEVIAKYLELADRWQKLADYVKATKPGFYEARRHWGNGNPLVE